MSEVTREVPGPRQAAIHVLLLVLAYCVAFGPLALINQPFWDDWVLIAHSPASLLEMFRQAGRTEHFLLLVPYNVLGVPFAWAATSTLLYGLVPPIVYFIIRKATPWTPSDAFWVAMLTALAPLNLARFPLSTLPYAFSCVFFTLAVLVHLHDLERPSWPKRILTSLLLLASFPTNSFLVLAGIVPVLGALRTLQSSGDQSMVQRLKGVVASLLARAELLLLPFIYWTCKSLLQPTYGLYQNYNSFRLPLARAFIETIKTIVRQVSGAGVLIPEAGQLVQAAAAALVTATLLGGIVFLARVAICAPAGGPSRARNAGDLVVAAIALCLVFAALFPYVLVDQPPRFADLWETRHQTVLMLVAGLAVYAVLRVLLSRAIVCVTAAAISFAYLTIDIATVQRVHVDGLEMRAAQMAFGEAPLAAGTMALVVENDRPLRALGRHFAFYELSSLVNKAIGPSAIFAFSNREVIDPATDTYAQKLSRPVVAEMTRICTRFRDRPEYGFGGFAASGSLATVVLTPGREPPGLIETLRLAWLGVMNPAMRDAEVRGLVSISVDPGGGGDVALPLCGETGR